MIPALRAEVRRLLSLRSTAVFAALLTGCCFGPIIVMGVVYAPDYQGPIDASDLGKCVSVFHVLALVFAGSHTATEIRSGSSAISFLTQRNRWSSLTAQYLVESAFLVTTYCIGMPLALLAASLYPDGMDLTGRSWPYLGLYLVIVLVWSSMGTSIAIITRSVAAAVAVPITWMLLIEQLIARIPMFEWAAPWLPFTASHSLLSRVLGEGVPAGQVWTSVIAVLVAPLALAALAFTLHGRRDAP